MAWAWRRLFALLVAGVGERALTERLGHDPGQLWQWITPVTTRRRLRPRLWRQRGSSMIAAMCHGSTQLSANDPTIIIEGAAIPGNAIPITITVPARYGHYSKTFAQVFHIPALGGELPGWAQVQVAP